MKGLLAAIDELSTSIDALADFPGTDVEQERAQVRALREHLGVRQSFAPATLLIGLAGTTGAGKSSLFNSLTGSTAAEVGVRRPTTTAPMAALYGKPEEGAGGLLDWLGVTNRYTVTDTAPNLGQVILIDLPDIDSISTQNRDTASRFIGSVDVIIWVVDPEKYADARVHDEYLRPYAEHAPVMEILLNQVDRLTASETQGATEDLRRLLQQSGITSQVSAVSVSQGVGIDELIARIQTRSREKKDQHLRALADARALARNLGQAHPFTHTGAEFERAQAEFRAEVATAVHVQGYGQAAARRYRHDLKSTVGWPPLRAVRKASKTPLQPMLATGFLGGPIARLRSAFTGPGAWNQTLRTTVDMGATDLIDRLDTYRPRALSPRPGAWLRFVGVLQWLGLLVITLGALAFGVEILARYFGITLPPALTGVEASPGYPALPALRWSYLIAIIGVLLTIVVMLVATLSVRVAVARYRRRMIRQMTVEVAEITDAAMVERLRSITAAGESYTEALIKITSEKLLAAR